MNHQLDATGDTLRESFTAPKDDIFADLLAKLDASLIDAAVKVTTKA